MAVHPVIGLIAVRWEEYGGSDGPFGEPLGPELPVEGRNGRRQGFENGEIAWCPDEDLVVSVFRLRAEAYVEWSRSARGYEFFRFESTFDGEPQGHGGVERRFDADLVRRPHVWMRLQGAGEYGFTVRGCDSPLLGADECTAPTIPVRIGFRPSGGPQPAGEPSVTGLIAERWQELGGPDGPLGRPRFAATEGPPGLHRQVFERGCITTAPHLGPGMAVAAYQRGADIEAVWGGSQLPFTAFQVVVRLNGQVIRQDIRRTAAHLALDAGFARSGTGSGFYRLADEPPGDIRADGIYEIFVHAAVVGDFVLVVDPQVFAGSEPTPAATVQFVRGHFDVPLTSVPPFAEIPAHARAFATHEMRIAAVVGHYTRTRPLRVVGQPDSEATETDSAQLAAHLHAVSLDRDFRVVGELPSRILAAVRLRQLRHGKVGTHADYDMALKGLMMIVCRYRGLFTAAQIGFVLGELVPPGLDGGHSQASELHFPLTPITPAAFVAETENHLLMIESSRYLVNQMQFERTGDGHFDNSANGLGTWLVEHLQRLVRHDFLEFNSRAYQRLSVHALLNLAEFARDEPLRTAARLVLDYLAVKFAVSSNRLRRLGPFRRLQERVNRPAGEFNDLLAGRGDQWTGFFHAYVGPLDRNRAPGAFILDPHTANVLIAGLSTYRPPAAAYRLVTSAHPPHQHRFHHGVRPQLAGSPDVADPGVEIYHSSPSFLLTAGGMFLNSGYGFDEVQLPGLTAWAQVAIAQSTTLVPTGADLKFAELIRFDRYPDKPFDQDDPQDPRGVNTGVHEGFACGANLRIPDLWFTATGAPRDGRWFIVDLDQDLPGLGRLGLRLAAYRTPAQPDDDLEPGLDNLGLLFAMEAADIEFATFRDRILAENAQLPATMSYTGTFTFHAPDGRRFSFRFGPQGEKYRARVTAVDDAALPDPLTLLPLVEGPFLRSSGHEGLIEIHEPGCPTPLVLDFRDPRQPVRIDNAAACPTSTEERTAATAVTVRSMLAQSSVHSVAGDPGGAITAARLAVAALTGVEPPPTARAEHLRLLAEAHHTTALRLVEAGRPGEAAPLVAHVVGNFRAAVTAGADAATAAGRLEALSGHVANARPPQTAAAVDAARAAVELITMIATPADPGAHLAARGGLLHVLALRLIEDGRAAEGNAPATEAVSALRDAAGAGADAALVADRLDVLCTHTSGAGLTAVAAAAAQAAVEVHRSIPVPPQGTADHRALLGVRLHTLGVRLHEDGRSAAALTALDEAIGVLAELVEEDPDRFGGTLAAVRAFADSIGGG